MEEWEKILESYEINCDSKTFNSVVRSAKYALNEDLAPFESDWVFSTLLKRPVNLLEVVAEHRMSDEYSKCIVESLKLLGDAIDKYDNFEKYYEEVSQLCSLQYPAVPRQQALCCLNRLARRAPCAARGLRCHLAALQQGVCMAPLAILIGTICEHHPHAAADDVINIWRVLLNLLDSNKYSGSVMRAVLQGILGLFKHFGDELPTMELIKFYEQLVAHLEVNSCQEVCLAILTHHANLFFTCVNRDASTRAFLWRLNAFEALQAVYTVCDETVLREVRAYTSSPHPRVRRAARRLLGARGGAAMAGGAGEDAHELEDALRSGRGDSELGDKVSWSIQTNARSNHRLLQAAMLFYDSFPPTSRTDVLLAILYSETHVVNAAVTFLIAEIIRNQKLTIWRDMLKCDNERLTIVYDNINKYINAIVEGVLEGMDGPPLSSLLPLLLSLPPRASLRCGAVRRLRVPCDTTALLAAFSGARNISLDDVVEDEVKIKFSLVVLSRMDEHTYPVRVSLAALQTIFSTKNIEADVLSKAVAALEVLVRGRGVDECVLAEIIHSLEKVRSRTDRTRKADRILQRDILMFVGKHRKMEFNDNELNSLIVELRNILSVQITHDAGTFQINLDGVLHSALQLEDEGALNVLTSLMCANLSSGGAPSLRRALLRVCARVSHTHAHILRAVRVCDATCADTLLQCIMREKSSESRKILVEAFETLMRKDADRHVLETIVEGVIHLEDQSTFPSYVHVLDTINSLLKDNNSVCLKLLPDFMIKVLKTPKSENVITNTYNLFVDKMYLFDDVTLTDVVTRAIRILNTDGNTTKNNMTLDFIKHILIKIRMGVSDFIENVEDLKLLVSMRRCFDFDVTLKKSALERVRRTLFENCHDLESVLLFLDVYCDVLLEREREKTVSLLCRIIQNLSSQDIRDNSTSIIGCIKSLKNHLQVIPREITNSIENYIRNINVDELRESVAKNGFNSENESTIHAIKVMVEALDGSILSDFDSFIVTWKDMFHKLYNSGYVKICLESKVDVLSDLTFVALKFMNENEIKCIILQGPDDFGISFTCALMCVFFSHLSASLLTDCSTLLYQVLTHTRGGRGVADLIDQVWPYYEKQTTFRQKQQFLLHYLPRAAPSSEPVKWLILTMNSSTDVENKLMILDALPRGDIYAPLPLLLLPPLPSRLSELEGSSAGCFRAILDALVVNTHAAVLEAVATLAANDSAAGWWDSALSACMSSISREGEGAARLVWEACGRAGHGAFRRLMMPLLRHSKSSVIESFVSTILGELLSTLRRTPRGGAGPRGAERHLLEHVRAFNVLELVFQRVPREHIESPRSQLYRHMSVDAPFHLVSLVCKLCVTLRAQGVQADRDTHRLFLMANYRCLSAALLCRGPRPHVYRSVLDPGVWRPLLAHDDEPRTFTPRAARTASVTRPAARLSSVRSRVFLRTLSENPLAYDLLEEEEEEEIITEDIQLPDSPLNGHPCMAAVTALLNAVGAEGGGGAEVIRGGVLKALEGEKLLATFVAQAVCNAREALRGHSGSLTPALCAMVGGRVDDLQVHVLDTIIHWRAELADGDTLSRAVESVIATIADHGQTDGLYRMLMDRLIKLFDIYGTIITVSWSCFEKYFEDPKSKSFEMCLRILNRINIYVPELLPALSLHLERRMTLLWSAYGRALRATHERGGGEGELKRFRGVCDVLRRSESAEYIKALYYVQKEHRPACDTQHYRSIVDLVPKIPRRERPRCLTILSTYVELRGDAHGMLETVDLLEEMDTVQGLELAKVCLPLMSSSLRDRVRASAGAKMGRGGPAEAAYRLLLRDFELSTSAAPSVKRRTLTPHPHVYTAVGVAKGLERFRGRVEGLSADLGVRFCECFVLCVLVPLTHHLNVNMAAILDLFFQDIKQQEVFKNAKLREDDPVLRTPSNTGTLSGNQRSSDTDGTVDVELSIEDVLNCIIEFARRVDRASTCVVIELVRALGAPRAGFDLHHTMSDIVSACVPAAAGAGGVLRAARRTRGLDDLRIDVVKNLVHRMRSSEGEGVSRALYEELLMRRGREAAWSINEAAREHPTQVPGKFSMKDLISTFDKLSSWDNIAALPHPLPPLWTDTHTFKSAVDRYDFTDGPPWLRAMVSRYKGEDIHPYKIFKDLDKWPRRHFDIGAVLESLDRGASNAQTHIHPSECMAQWAARIMVGSLYAGTSHLPSRSLAWCERAMELSLFEQVVQCCETVTKTEREGVNHLIYQKMLALRGIALERNDRESLRNLLIGAETRGALEPTCDLEDALQMRGLAARLRRDVDSLETGHVDSIIRYIKQNISHNFKTESVSTICVLGMTHFSKTFEGTADIQEQGSLLLSMCELIGLRGAPDLPLGPLMCDAVLHALDHYGGEALGADVADAVLNTLQPIIPALDECSLNVLKSSIHLFPEHAMLRELHQNGLILDKYRQCLSVISDPVYLLRQYCGQLIYHMERNNERRYRDVFVKMKRQVFENPYSGPDYRVLHKYITRLDEVDFAADKQPTKQVLINIQSELVSKRDTLSLSDVCPTLSREKDSESLNRLLGLRRGLRVVKFEEKLSVYTGAVSRPVLISFLSSDGVTRRRIVKREGGGHAAVMRGRRAVGGVVGASGGYTVNTISDECLLIEYLEHHTPLRDLVTSVRPIEVPVRETVDLIRSPAAARQQYEARAAAVPPHTLRSAIEARCATFEDFLYKKKNFQQSVCWMTILNFLFGLSDRHLENILYDEVSGAACDVDCGDLSHGEIPPARLTRNILGVCDRTALEGSLQRCLSRIREHEGVILPSIKLAFKNTEEKYRDKIRFIQGKVRGSLLPHQVSRESIPHSPLQHHDKYILLLEQVFGTDAKAMYSVQEQVSSLLVQCTDPRILSVTRTGWEPWI